MVITKEMALASLRPAFDEWYGRNAPTEQEINAEKLRLDKNTTENEKKALRRKAQPADVNDLAELAEDLAGRIFALNSLVLSLQTRITTLEGRKNT